MESNSVCNYTRISNGNRTEWSPIRSVIIRVIINGNRTELSPVRSVIIPVTNAPRKYDLFITSTITDRVITNA